MKKVGDSNEGRAAVINLEPNVSLNQKGTQEPKVSRKRAADKTDKEGQSKKRRKFNTAPVMH